MQGKHTTFGLSLKYILCLHCVGVLFMSFIRIGLLTANTISGNVNFDLPLALHALLIGLNFDNFVASFITLPLTIVISTTSLLGIHPKKLSVFVKSWNFFFYSIIIILSISNIRYFSFFDNHLSASAFKWFAFPAETTGLLLEDSNNYKYLLFIAVTLFLYIKTHLIAEQKIFSLYTPQKENAKIILPALVVIMG